MKCLVLLIISLFYFSNLSHCQTGLQFDSLSYNFRKVEYGTSNNKRKLCFRNSSDKPVTIKRVRTGDGGTMAEWPKEIIQPGESGEITFIFNSKRIGPNWKTVTIQTNLGVTILRCKVYVIPPSEKESP